MAETTYAMHGGVAGRERLRVLAGILRPSTRALLERAGVAAGMACLDVGCGGGDVSVELAALVGPSGQVLGLDRDADVIALAGAEATARGLARVAFRAADVTALDARGAYDVVYARFLLSHLPDPAAALAAMCGAARPGGRVVLEDIDFRGHFAHPEHAAFARYVDLYTAVVRRRGADPHLGARLPALLAGAGCTSIDVHVVQPAALDGAVKQMAPLTVRAIAAAAIDAGLAGAAEIDAMVRDLETLAADGRTLMSLPRIVQAWGRRAMSDER